jgi:ABC-type branched-subunit amino acid transport system ATPase component/branched-subunit amino acid ABC-type transport system permease component
VVVATWITKQLVFDGFVTGLVIGLLAMGIVLIYRSTRVINFAVGNMGLVGTALLAIMVVDHGIPFWLAVIACLAVGALYGALMEVAVIRRLFAAPRVIVLVATIGLAQLSLAVVVALPKLETVGAGYPVASHGQWTLLGIDISGSQASIIVVVPIVAAALAWFLNRTMIGKAVKAAAENSDLARLSGINPKLVSLLVWTIGGFLATLSMILIAGQANSSGTLAALGPSTLVRALAAAVIGGMVSFPIALVAGIGIGITEAVVRFNFLADAGLIDFLLFLAVLVAVWLQSRQPGETQAFSFAPKVKAVPERLREVWWVRNLSALTLGTLGIAAVLLPIIVTQPSRQLVYASIVVFAVCGLSVTVLTGWAGQLSLGQMAFAGLGALLAAALTRGFALGIGWRDDQLFDIHVHSMPSLLAIAISTLLVAGLAALIGLGALRVRGLLLAVSTFAFGVAAQQYLYRRPVFSDGNSVSVPLPRGTLFGLDLSSQRTYYYVVLGVLALTLVVVARLRRSGIGRTTIAVRDNQDTAAGYSVAPARVKLRAFALAGGIAALGGAFLGALVTNVPLTDRFFTVESSLQLVSLAVIGGLGSIAGPVLGSLWIVGLPAFFPDNQLVPLFTSSVGLLVLLLYFPGGLVQIAYSARNALLGWAEKRIGPAPTKTIHDTPPAVTMQARPDLALSGPALVASEVTVRFVGLVATDAVSLEVGANEIVGLIGTNGAGKSTLMNAIGGYLPSTGTVQILGDDVSGLRPAARARRGLGRTFQAATLFPELTVRETVQVALEARGRTGILTAALLIPRSNRLERAKRADAAELIDFLGLGRYADMHISELSTGTRRIVELAGLLALDARVLCLDEPTAGIAQRETEAFGPLIVEIRRELGASMLVIEHDMPLIMSISDRVYCLEAGRIIADGAPSAVRDNPLVIASYLGTDERAIARSGTAALPVPTVEPAP